MSMSKKIVLLGCSGFIGSAILERFGEQAKKDLMLIGTYHQHRPAVTPSPNVSVYQLDVTDQIRLQQLLQTIQPDIIINTIAISTIDACERNKKECDSINVDPTKTIVEYCKHNPLVKYIFFSSDHVFDGKKQEPYTEKDPTGPVNYYGTTKLESEQIITSTLTNYAILRLCFVFGVPKQYHHPNLFSTIYDTLSQKKHFSAYYDRNRSPSYIRDIPKVVEQAIKKNKKGLFLIGGETMTVYEFARSIAQAFTLDQTMIKKTTSIGKETVSRPQNCSVERAFTEQSLGIKFRSLPEAFQDIKRMLP